MGFRQRRKVEASNESANPAEQCGQLDHAQVAKILTTHRLKMPKDHVLFPIVHTTGERESSDREKQCRFSQVHQEYDIQSDVEPGTGEVRLYRDAGTNWPVGNGSVAKGRRCRRARIETECVQKKKKSRAKAVFWVSLLVSHGEFHLDLVRKRQSNAKKRCLYPSTHDRLNHYLASRHVGRVASFSWF